MELYSAVERRRTIRDFSEREVPQAALRRVIEAGLKAPSHNHLRQWVFILVKDPAKRRDLVVAEGIREVTDVHGLRQQFTGSDSLATEMYLDAIPKQKKMLLTAPELLAVVYKKKLAFSDCKRLYDLNDFASVWCAIENVLLAMAVEGLYGVTYIPQQNERVREVLGVPEEYEVPVLLALGYPDGNRPLIKQKEIDVDAHIRVDGF